jgi:hypothetical protein
MDSQSIKNELLEISERLSQLAISVMSVSPNRIVDGFPSDKLQLVTDKICLRCNKRIEDGEKELRGNHSKCYKATNRQIEAGEFTEDEAVEAGLYTPPKKAGRKTSTERRDVLDQIKEVRRQKEERANGDSTQ